MHIYLYVNCRRGTLFYYQPLSFNLRKHFVTAYKCVLQYKYTIFMNKIFKGNFHSEVYSQQKCNLWIPCILMLNKQKCNLWIPWKLQINKNVTCEYHGFLT